MDCSLDRMASVVPGQFDDADSSDRLPYTVSKSFTSASMMNKTNQVTTVFLERRANQEASTYSVAERIEAKKGGQPGRAFQVTVRS
uniref:RIO kinase 1 n=1 Tax=Mus musculus TaxID=10090 RepID=A0A286YDM8_MOUSE